MIGEAVAHPCGGFAGGLDLARDHGDFFLVREGVAGRRKGKTRFIGGEVHDLDRDARAAVLIEGDVEAGELACDAAARLLR